MSSSGGSAESLVLSRARFYDALTWALTRGRERQFRRNVLGHVRLAPGESVLDVGCGTGTLAILARDRVGTSGEVFGTDASPPMIARAQRRAAREGVEVTFERAPFEDLPFPAERFDVVLSSLMLHHVPAEARDRGMAEVARVLRPGGRFLAVDIGRDAAHPEASAEAGSWVRRRLGFLHRPHGHHDYSFEAVVDGVGSAGLEVVDRGSIDSPRIIGLPDIGFLLATKPA